jgi:hypothetical protein
MRPAYGTLEALGRKYTAVLSQSGQITFHLLDLNTVETGMRITVTTKGKLRVEFPSVGRWPDKSVYPLDAVPVQSPFRNPKRVKAWEEFIDAMQTPPPMERMHEAYEYNR